MLCLDIKWFRVPGGGGRGMQYCEGQWRQNAECRLTWVGNLDVICYLRTQMTEFHVMGPAWTVHTSVSSSEWKTVFCSDTVAVLTAWRLIRLISGRVFYRTRNHIQTVHLEALSATVAIVLLRNFAVIKTLTVQTAVTNAIALVSCQISVYNSK